MMRKVLLLILVLIGGYSYGQVYQQMSQYGVEFKRMDNDSVLRIPRGLGSLRSISGYDTAQIRYNVSDSSVYVHTGNGWIKVVRASGGGADSAVFATVHKLYTTIDSLGNLIISENLGNTNLTQSDAIRTYDGDGGELSFSNLGKFKVSASDSVVVNSSVVKVKPTSTLSVDSVGYMEIKHYDENGDVLWYIDDGGTGVNVTDGVTTSSFQVGSTDFVVNTEKINLLASDSIVINNTPSTLTTDYDVLVRDENTGKVGIATISGGGGSDSAIWKSDATYNANHTLSMANKVQYFSNGTLQADSIRGGTIVNNTTQDIVIGGTSIEVGYYSTGNTGIHRYTTRLANALGLTELNYAVGGGVATSFVLSNIPTYNSTHKYLLFSYGTNEVINGVDTSTTKTNFQAILTNAFSKGWSGSNIIIVSNWYTNPTNANTAILNQTNMFTMVNNLATTNGCIFVDVWNTQLANLTAIPLVDNVHPSDDGHALAFKKVMSVLQYPTVSNGQTLSVNGTTKLNKVQLLISDTCIASQTDPLGFDFVKQTVVQQTPNTYIKNIDTLSSLTPQSASINIARSLRVGKSGIIGKLLINGNDGYVSNSPLFKGLNIGTLSGVAYIQNASANGVTGNLTIQSYGTTTIGTLGVTNGLTIGGGIVANGGLSGASGVNIGVSGGYGYFNMYGTYLDIAIATNSGSTVNIGNAAKVASAKLNITSTTQGVLIPRYTTSNKTAISTPTKGLLVYDSTTNNLSSSDGTVWYNYPKVLTNSATLDFGSTSAQSSADLTITVTGAADGDMVSLGVSNAATLTNSTYTAWVSATNTVTVRYNNYSGGSQDPASATFKVQVFK
jgi:hypothetical protein